MANIVTDPYTGITYNYDTGEIISAPPDISKTGVVGYPGATEPGVASVCTEGATKGMGAGKQTCVNNTWIPTPEPVCEEGATFGTGQGKTTCVNGNWVHTPEGGGAGTSVCTGGAVIGTGTEKFTCMNNSWVRTPDYAEGEGEMANLGEVTRAPWETMGMGEGEQFSPFTQYLTQRGLTGLDYMTPAQKYMSNLYNPMRFMWEAQQPIQTALGRGTLPWQEYMGGLTGGMGDIRRRAESNLMSLRGMTPAKRQEWGLGFEPEYDPFTGEALPFSQTGAQPLSYLQNLMQYGLAERFGPYGAGWASQRLPFMQQQWEASGQPSSFLEYALNKYNL